MATEFGKAEVVKLKKYPDGTRLVQEIIRNDLNGTGGKVNLPTESMCDAARWFILARDANIHTWGGLTRCIDKTIPWIQEQMENNPTGHITKWDFAEGVYRLMEQARNEYSGKADDKQ